MSTKANVESLSFEKTDSIVLNPDGQMIGKFREGLRIDDSGEIFSFVDDIFQQIFLFNREGNLINIIGGTGSGPNEFRQIAGYYVDNERLIVIDESQYLVKIFNIDGTLVKSFPLFDNEKLMVASRDLHVHEDLLYVQIVESKFMSRISDSKLIAKIDLSTGQTDDLLGHYDPYIDIQNHYLSMQNFTVDENEDKLITSFVTTYGVQVFDVSENKRDLYFHYKPTVWNERNEEIKRTMRRNEIRQMSTGTSYSTGIFVTDKFVINHFQTLTDKWVKTSSNLSKENYLSFYNKSGELYYGTLKVDGYVGDVHDGQFFLINSFDPDQFKIGVYELHMD